MFLGFSARVNNRSFAVSSTVFSFFCFLFGILEFTFSSYVIYKLFSCLHSVTGDSPSTGWKNPIFPKFPNREWICGFIGGVWDILSFM